ncbi:MAG: hypothetical protein ACREKQ_17080, partial [Candidatus Rokuibacteriota bacterium]
EMGFAHVESGPLVRSSYHAKRQTDSARAGGQPQWQGEAQPKASRADMRRGRAEASQGEAQPKASRAD